MGEFFRHLMMRECLRTGEVVGSSFMAHFHQRSSSGRCYLANNYCNDLCVAGGGEEFLQSRRRKVPYKPCALGNYSLAIDHCPPVENLASLVNGFLIHVVVSHRHLHVTVAQQISKRW